MVVQHNMAAQNAAGQSAKTQKNLKTSTEQLSTGYRINRAADDAAGLAISEKMRWQIRGLEQGSENLQDGISLTQVADGALNETHALLQRIRELSVQAANDTNTEADRNAIQQEVNQLCEEVDAIAHSTNFNEAIYPLLGSAVIDGYLPDPDYASVLDKYVLINDPVIGGTGGIGMYIKGMGDYAGAIGGYGNNGHALVQMTLADGTKTPPINMFQSSKTDGSVTITRSYTQDSIEFEYEDSANGVHFKVSTTCEIVEENDPATLTGGQYFLSSFNITNLGVPIQGMDVLLHTDPIHGYMSGDPTLNGNSLNSKDFGEIVDPTKDYSFVCSPGSFSGYTNCDVTAKMTGDHITDPPDVIFAGNEYKQDAKQNQYNMDIMTGIYNGTFTPDYSSDYHFGAGWVNRPLNTGSTFTASTMFGLSYPITLPSGDPTISADGIWIQCNSTKGNALRIPLVDATAATLKIKEPYPDVTSHQAASASMALLDEAIETVSKYRTNFGVYQNAMESIRRNVDTAAENTQASESRIRDTDMADVMVTFSKYNILSQSVTAMLAQANQNPESILQLLQ